MSSPLVVTLGARMSVNLTTAEDYHRNRQRLNKNLKRLRHALGITTRNTKNYKNNEKTSTISANDYQRDQRFGSLLLMTSERDLLYSLEIRSLLDIGNENASCYKNLMITRTKRALKNVKKLLEVISTEKDETVVIEYFIYAALIQGSLSLTKKQWDVSLNAFAIARCCLEFLNSKMDNSSKDIDDDSIAFRKTLIEELIESVVDPSLRLSLTQSTSETSDLKSASRKHCHDGRIAFLKPSLDLLRKLDPSFVSELTESVELIKAVTWRGHVANLYSEEIAFSIMKLTDSETHNWKNFTRGAEFDSLISGWSEILLIHESDSARNQDSDDLEEIQNRAILSTYIKYNLLFTQIERDLLLVSQLLESKKDQTKIRKLGLSKDAIRLYSNIIASVSEIKGLPGVYNDNDLLHTLETLETFYDAKKSFELACAFSLCNKFFEALKILDHLKNSMRVPPQSVELPYEIRVDDQYRSFDEELSKASHRIHILAQFAHDYMSHTYESNYVIKDVNRYHMESDSKTVINFEERISLEPVLSKAIFFDIGFNYLGYDKSSLDTDTTKSNDGGLTGKKGKKLFGLFGLS